MRLGWKGRPFKIYKFRTMIENAPDLRNPDGSAATYSNDPRVTKVGYFLRKWSLDELPQLINVLKGEMSLIGPRPELVDQINYYTCDELLRLEVKPGMSGLAQVKGRNKLSWHQRKKYDIEYVRRQSLKLDLYILIATIKVVLNPDFVFSD